MSTRSDAVVKCWLFDTLPSVTWLDNEPWGIARLSVLLLAKATRSGITPGELAETIGNDIDSYIAGAHRHLRNLG